MYIFIIISILIYSIFFRLLFLSQSGFEISTWSASPRKIRNNYCTFQETTKSTLAVPTRSFQPESPEYPRVRRARFSFEKRISTFQYTLGAPLANHDTLFSCLLRNSQYVGDRHALRKYAKQHGKLFRTGGGSRSF